MTTSLYEAEECIDQESRMIFVATTVPMINLQLSFIDVDGYCIGLLYFVDKWTAGRILAANPLRSQFTTLPPTPISSIWIGIGLARRHLKVIPHPEITFRCSAILEIKGNLGMLDTSGDIKYDLWVVDYNEKSWSYWSYSMKTGNLECKEQSSNAHVSGLKGSLIPIPGCYESLSVGLFEF
ncbi:hypothetical protein AgCh_003561 [Apium graveolens]